jgi:hypothetical protein
LVADTDATGNRARDPESLANATSLTTFHDWSGLPEELKLEVLSHNLAFAGDIDCWKHRDLLQSTLSPLIATRNRHLTSLAEEVYYNSNCFTIDIEEELDCPKPRTAAMIRHLHVKIVDGFLTSPPDPDTMSGVPEWLLKLQEPFGSTEAGNEWSEPCDQTNPGSRLHWQTTLTDLHTLKLTWYATHWVEAGLPPSQCCCLDPTARWRAIRDWLEKTEMHADYLRPGLDWQRCRAHDDVLKYLKDMATKE